MRTSEWDKPKEWPNSWAATWNKLVPETIDSICCYCVTTLLFNCITFVRVDAPRFGFIKMRIATVDREVSVSQSTAATVERISIAVFAFFKPMNKETLANCHWKLPALFKNLPNFDVNFISCTELYERQFGDIGPNLKGLGQLSVHMRLLELAWILGNAVRQFLDTPTTSCCRKYYEISIKHQCTKYVTAFFAPESFLTRYSGNYFKVCLLPWFKTLRSNKFIGINLRLAQQLANDMKRHDLASS